MLSSVDNLANLEPRNAVASSSLRRPGGAHEELGVKVAAAVRGQVPEDGLSSSDDGRRDLRRARVEKPTRRPYTRCTCGTYGQKPRPSGQLKAYRERVREQVRSCAEQAGS